MPLSNTPKLSDLSLGELPLADVSRETHELGERIAYQFANQIQSHAMLLILERGSHTILHVSENCREVVGCDPPELVGSSADVGWLRGLAGLLNSHTARAVDAGEMTLDEQSVDCRGVQMLCSVLTVADRIFVELEPLSHADRLSCPDAELQDLIYRITADLSQALPIESLIEATTRDLQRVLGFYRGLAYRFDEEENGEVIAEYVGEEEPERYLGLRFPAADIPPSVRRMLIDVGLRVTSDQLSECAPIYPDRDSCSNQYLDLTHIRARGAGEACRQYYLNLGIRATVILPLVVAGRMWGMLAFHDPQPRRLHPRHDRSLKTVARCLSLGIERKIRASIAAAEQRGKDQLASLADLDSNSPEWLTTLSLQTPKLREMLPCGGFLMRIGGKVFQAGDVPSVDNVGEFIDRLWRLADGQVLSTHDITQFGEDYERYAASAAGLIVAPLLSGRQDVMIWMRPCQEQTTTWGGGASSYNALPILCSDARTLNASFARWTTVTHNKSLRWTHEEVVFAGSLAQQLGLLALSWYACQANHSKSQFLACMSHEIRTPMNAILGFTELLKEESAEESTVSKSNEYVDIISRNGKHLLSLIDDILDLAKIESGKLDVERVESDVAAVVSEVVELMRVRAEAKQLPLLVELVSAVPAKVKTDAFRLRQILINLVGNAIKFTDQGHVTIRIAYDGDGERLLFEIVDSGIGLTHSQQQRLFQSFSQAETSTAKNYGGSGLGLQISRKLAQLLGGDIEVRSEQGVGSTFALSIDAGTQPGANCGAVELLSRATWMPLQATGRKDDLHSRQPSNSELPLEGLRIMVLEDGLDNQRLIHHLLTKAGAVVKLFEDGQLGLVALTVDGMFEGPLKTDIPFDLILSDIQMPNCDGLEFIRQLRSRGCSSPAVALTAHAMRGDSNQCLAAGFNDYLVKPINRQALIDMCTKWSDAGTTRVGTSQL